MRNNKSGKWACVIIIASVVAALTTVSILLLRAKAKKRSMCSYNDPLGFDLDDCCCEDGCCDNYCGEAEEPVDSEELEQE
jgi:hypothetical protein